MILWNSRQTHRKPCAVCTYIFTYRDPTGSKRSKAPQRLFICVFNVGVSFLYTHFLQIFFFSSYNYAHIFILRYGLISFFYLLAHVFLALTMVIFDRFSVLYKFTISLEMCCMFACVISQSLSIKCLFLTWIIHLA